MNSRSLAPELAQQAVDIVHKYGNFADAAKALGLARSTLHSRFDTAIALGYSATEGPRTERTEHKRFEIPKSRAEKIVDHTITNMTRALVISDIHIPYHDTAAVATALEYGYKHNADGIIINGDLIDLAPLSDHQTIPSRRQSLKADLDDTRAFLEMLARDFGCPIVWHEGNHETRAPRYFLKRAPELYGAEFDQDGHDDWLPRKLGFRGDWVANTRTMRLGKLSIIHGNQYKGGGIMAARTIFLRALDNVLSSDKHRTQEYIDKRIGQQILGSWITGHLSEERPAWLSHNRWNHGFAFVEVESDGGFQVHNLKIVNGKVR